MRLTCPNCAAQYEVPDQVIPDDGRDVQCSSCAHTWFQTHDMPEKDDVAAAEPAAAPAPAPIAPPTDPELEPEPEPEPELATEPELAAVKAPEPAPTQPRGLDPEVAEVLRQEAEHEARRRADDAGVLESQPDLGLIEPAEDEAARRHREGREHMARLRGTETAPQAPAPIADPDTITSRGELLPNVDEINQTLRSTGERREVETPQGRAQVHDEPSSGFGRGFAYVVIIVALAIAVYLMADQIKGWVPALADTLDSYVVWVDGLRLWLDAQLGPALESLGASDEAPSDNANPASE